MSRHDVPPVRADDAATAVGGRIVGDASRTFTGISQDSREVREGDVFCCVRGAVTDGHLHARSAVAAGCRVLLCERELTRTETGADPEDLTQIVVDDVRACLGRFAAHVFGNPARRLRIVGVTGTNGKTSTVAILASILAESGEAVAAIGTLSGVRTTPEAIDLHARLRGEVDAGKSTVVMEVSSHALSLGRVEGIRFAAAVFTNLSRDHLDFHGDMESYFRAKQALFAAGRCELAVVNTDDEWGRRMVAEIAVPVVAYSPSSLEEARCGADSVSFRRGGRTISVPIGGRFTLANALAAVTTAEVLGASADQVVNGCARVPVPAGRFESVPNDRGIDVIVDYAHTPESLELLLASAREVCRGELTVVFGCGGGRDSGKRAPMGRAAALGADHVVVTSDNPRDEDPLSIIEAVVSGAREVGVEPSVEPDRAVAIASAISSAERGDMVVIAGKGHEPTQETAGSHLRFLDAEVAEAALRNRKGGGA